MIASVGGEFDLARLLMDLLVVIVAAKMLGEVAERCRVPAVLGEIVAGIVIGPSALGLVELDGARGVSLGVLAEIGVLLLLLQVGMEMDLAELGRVGKASLLVAVVGVVVPFCAGAGAGLALGQPGETAVFVGAALTATSVGITARVFGDLHALATTEARVVLGAAVADDVLGLVILTVVLKIVTGDSVGAGTVVGTLGLAALFLVGTGTVGLFLVPRLFDVIHRRASSPAAVSVAALALMVAFAELADAAKLAFIIGAFMAGLSLGASRHHERIARDLGAVATFFVPVFFALIGINADLDAMLSPSVLGLAATLFTIAVLGKLVAAIGMIGTRGDKVLVGIGMIPRGEVGLIFASIGLANGVLDADQYGALLLVVLLTTVVAPPLLRWRLGAAAVAETGPTSEEPAGGWLSVVGGVAQVDGVPPSDQVLTLGLQMATLTDRARPSPRLLEWFGAHRATPLRWSTAATPQLVRLLREDNPRAWRFLDVSGVLERALPELAAAMSRRRADIGDLDPLGALRFPVVERLDELAPEFGHPSDDLLLAALVADVCSELDEDDCAERLTQRLVGDRNSAEVLSIVDDARLLRAGVYQPDSFDEPEILQLATHFASAAHARNAHHLATAMGSLQRWQREALVQRLERIVLALDHPELTSTNASNFAAARRLAAERRLDEPAAVERLRHAPNAYLLAHDPEAIARQIRLIEPLPHRGVVRVAVTPEPTPDHWLVDVACRDADGLLARLAQVLTGRGLDIVSATLATWPDGAVLDSFVVATTSRPNARDLAAAFDEHLKGRLKSTPMPDLILTFDNDVLPWHTSVAVHGRDRPGALCAVAAAFATAGVVVHTARVATVADDVNDRFAVTDRVGRKLDPATIDRVRARLSDAAPRRHLARK